jgi:hypothetical protein
MRGGVPGDERRTRDRSKVRADGRDPPTLWDSMMSVLCGWKEGRDGPGEGDGVDVGVSDEEGLFGDEEELLLEEVELSLVGFHVAFDC